MTLLCSDVLPLYSTLLYAVPHYRTVLLQAVGSWQAHESTTNHCVQQAAPTRSRHVHLRHGMTIICRMMQHTITEQPMWTCWCPFMQGHFECYGMRLSVCGHLRCSYQSCQPAMYCPSTAVHHCQKQHRKYRNCCQSHWHQSRQRL